MVCFPPIREDWSATDLHPIRVALQNLTEPFKVHTTHMQTHRTSLATLPLLPVVVVVDRYLAGKAQHPAHNPAVVHGPALVTHLPPMALVPHLHSPLSHRAVPFGTGEDGFEPHLFQPLALQGIESRHHRPGP